MIFVFGSNLKGVHGAGAARHAYKNHGAVWGYGSGRSGNSYALPTKIGPWGTMDLDMIRRSVILFLGYADAHPDLKFKITQIGCGLARKTKEDIAPMFKRIIPIPSNCYFDTAWRELLPEGTHFWGSV